MEKTAVNKLILLFLFLYFVLHLSIMHYNQHQMSKLDIKNKKGYAIMTFITVYFFYLVVVPSLWLSYKNSRQEDNKPMTTIIAINGVLLFVYVLISIIFLKKNLIKGVSDKQRELCGGTIALTFLSPLIFIFFLENYRLRYKRIEHEKWYNSQLIIQNQLMAEDDQIQKEYVQEIEQWFEKIKEPCQEWGDSDNLFQKFKQIWMVWVKLGWEKWDLRNRLKEVWKDKFTLEKFQKIKENITANCTVHQDDNTSLLEKIIEHITTNASINPFLDPNNNNVVDVPGL